jgi:UDP:flavonoid glycosyltransferase YjiC (YdhE family)
MREHGAQIFFSTYLDGVRYVRHEGFSVSEVPPIGFTFEPDVTINFKKTAFFASLTVLRQVNAEIELMKMFKPDVVVSDSRVSPLIAAEMMGIPRLCILNQFRIVVPEEKRLRLVAKLVEAGVLTLIGKIWTAGARVLIPDFLPPYTLSVRNLQMPKSYRKSVRLIGPILPVHPYRLPSREKLRKKLQLSRDKPVIFVPISGPEKERVHFARLLRRIFHEFPKDYQVVMSHGLPNSSLEPRRYGGLTVFNWLAERFEYLKTCDLVVARAGHETLVQSICYGKPMILVPTPGHTEQFNNASKAVELGLAEMIEQKALNRHTLLSTVERMLHHDGHTSRRKWFKKRL